MPFFSCEGARLHYAIEGEGPPLILIAGLASDHASWAPVVPLLGRHFRLIMPDNRGSGQTGLLHDAPLTISTMADDVMALAEHLALGPALVLGHSMGAIIAADLALRAPERCRQLILAASALPIGSRQRHVIDALAAHGAMHGHDAHWYAALFGWLFAPGFFSDPRSVEVAVAAAMSYPHSPSPQMFARQIAAIKGYDLPAGVPQVPVDMLSGAQDVLMPPEACAAFARRLGARSCTMLAGAAHSLFWDAPEAAAEAVVRFAAA